jgi:hypothetical protein
MIALGQPHLHINSVVVQAPVMSTTTLGCFSCALPAAFVGSYCQVSLLVYAACVLFRADDDL